MDHIQDDQQLFKVSEVFTWEAFLPYSSMFHSDFFRTFSGCVTLSVLKNSILVPEKLYSGMAGMCPQSPGQTVWTGFMYLK